MGSLQHPTLTHLARTIWQWCEERDIWLYASYVSSVSNYLAHFESRGYPMTQNGRYPPQHSLRLSQNMALQNLTFSPHTGMQMPYLHFLAP